MSSVRFDCDIDALARDIELDADAVKRKIATDLFGELLATTPVDTGRARASWGMQADVPDYSFEAPYGETVYEATTPDPPINAKKICIYNNLEYIVPLNEGHSKQAPAMFVELAVQKTLHGLEE